MRRTIELHRTYRHGRQALVYPEPAAPRPTASRKDTKRWCRGKVGVHHRLAWVQDRRYEFTPRCTACGKIFGYCRPWATEPCKCGHHRARGTA